MRDRVTANLPARSFDETAAFYGALGFEVVFRDQGWMIVARGDLEIEFFPHPGLDPRESWFGACVRVADADRLHREWSAASLPRGGIPRMTEPGDDPSGHRMFAVVDPNGSLLRCMSPRDRG
jgi:catechol 2,3-dioxygenase-like lactoylglutathione lyase family enzyme